MSQEPDILDAVFHYKGEIVLDMDVLNYNGETALDLAKNMRDSGDKSKSKLVVSYILTKLYRGTRDRRRDVSKTQDIQVGQAR